MYMNMPQFGSSFPCVVFFDSKSREIGAFVPKSAMSVAIGGGSVKVKS